MKGPSKIPWLKIIFDPGVVNDDILHHSYTGSGTEEDPYLVIFFDNDPRDPQRFSGSVRWMMCAVVSLVTLSVNFLSSAYSGGIPQIQESLGGSGSVNALGISLFVVGFAVGPFLWAPLSELYGRQYLFWGTYAIHNIFNAAACATQTLTALLVIRFFAGVFGSAPLTNSGGVIADCFPPAQRGLAMMIFALGPLMGPVFGPVIGGVVSENIGWRWLLGILTMFTGILLIIGIFTLPETYGPSLLRSRASRLSKITGKVYVSHLDASTGPIRPAQAFQTALRRPWKFFFREPIVLLLASYQAIVLGILYMLFEAYPLVYEVGRGWSQTSTGLIFLAPLIGAFAGRGFSIWDDRRFLRICKTHPSGFAPPEERLPPACVGACALPVGLFWFAWTNGPGTNVWVSIAAGVPVGAGLSMILVPVQNYLVDAYTIYAASVLAGCVVTRSILAAAFPAFTPQMYASLGIHWASSIPAFLAVLCAPMPFLLYRFGPAIRKRCRYAREADETMKRIRGQSGDTQLARLAATSTADSRSEQISESYESE